MNILQIGCNHGKDHVLDFYREHYDDINKIVLVDASKDALAECSETYNNDSKCEFLNYAVVTTAETQVKFYQPLGDTKSGHASIFQQHTISHLHPQISEEIVPAININILLELYNPIDRLYIDTEGLDAQIIKAINFSKYKIPYIFFEFVHSDGAFTVGQNCQQAINILQTNRYKLTKIENNIEACLS
jgi:FkbM family methyltransferase